ncbi:lipid droplet assembly factor 1-like isoform X2 [Epinephelus moara]|nr:lipid droplet assembly factor 1-like isoform X2 [Epinephelus moara]
MQPSSNSSSEKSELQQLWRGWSTMVKHYYDDPKVAHLMKTRIGQYLSTHPVFALTVLLFGAMAALPVGLFLSFALVTFIMAAVGFVFFEGFLLFIGGVTLLCVLTGIAFFSVMASFIFSALYIIITNIFHRYYPHLKKQRKVQETESESDTSETKDTQ